MTDIAFTPFSASLNDKPTSFGLYDSDAIFQADADKIVYFVMRNLGTPVVDAELDLLQIWTSFEAAALEYSSEINKSHARNVLIDMLGQGTGSLSGSEQIYPLGNSMEMSRKLTLQYATEFGVGGGATGTWLTASVRMVPDQQKYNLWNAVSASLSGTANDGKTIVIRKIHHYEPTAMYRFFDTTSVLNYLGNAMGFQSYSPETIFYLLPIWEDVLRGIQLELNQRVRRSNYSFDLKGFELTVYPVPGRETNLFFEYTVSPTDPTAEVNGNKVRGVTSNISNIAFGHIGYKDINSIGKVWIWKMTVAFCKEVLGQIRSKYSELPTLPDPVTMNGEALIQQGREDQANMRLELKELLDQMSYKNLMAEKVELQNIAASQYKLIPIHIYVK